MLLYFRWPPTARFSWSTRKNLQRGTVTWKERVVVWEGRGKGSAKAAEVAAAAATRWAMLATEQTRIRRKGSNAPLLQRFRFNGLPGGRLLPSPHRPFSYFSALSTPLGGRREEREEGTKHFSTFKFWGRFFRLILLVCVLSRTFIFPAFPFFFLRVLFPFVVVNYPPPNFQPPFHQDFHQFFCFHVFYYSLLE